MVHKFLSLKELKKILYCGHTLLTIVMEKKWLERLMKMNWKKQIKKELRIEKVIKKKGDKLYVKWKGYYSLFNNWIDKKDIVWVNIFLNQNL